jgi:hypothetical protein
MCVYTNNTFMNRFRNYVNAASASFVQTFNRPWVVGGGTGTTTGLNPLLSIGGDGGTTPGGTGGTSVSPHVCNGGGITTV